MTSILAATGVCAEASGAVTYNDIKLSSFSGIYEDGDYIKTTNNEQTIHTIDARDALIWNNTRAVEARVKHMAEPTFSTAWKQLVIGDTVSLGADSARYGSNYRLQLRAKSSTLAQTRYWGTWVY